MQLNKDNFFCCLFFAVLNPFPNVICVSLRTALRVKRTHGVQDYVRRKAFSFHMSGNNFVHLHWILHDFRKHINVLFIFTKYSQRTEWNNQIAHVSPITALKAQRCGFCCTCNNFASFIASTSSVTCSLGFSTLLSFSLLSLEH